MIDTKKGQRFLERVARAGVPEASLLATTELPPRLCDKLIDTSSISIRCKRAHGHCGDCSPLWAMVGK